MNVKGVTKCTLMSLLKEILFLGLAFFLVSCSRDENDPVKIAEQTNKENLSMRGQSEAEYIVDAYSWNLYEMYISEDAESLSTSLEIQNLGTQLAAFYIMLNNQIREIADKKNINLPQGLTEKQLKARESLREKVGYDFNVAYTKEVYEKRKNAVEVYKSIINNKSVDPEIKAWAETTLPEVQQHLSKATVCYEHTKMPQ